MLHFTRNVIKQGNVPLTIKTLNRIWISNSNRVYSSTNADIPSPSQTRKSKSRKTTFMFLFSSVGGSLMGGLYLIYHYPEYRRKIEQTIPQSKELFNKVFAYFESINALAEEKANEMLKKRRLEEQQKKIVDSINEQRKMGEEHRIKDRIKEELKIKVDDDNGKRKELNMDMVKEAKVTKAMEELNKLNEERKIAEAVEEQRILDEQLAKMHLELELKRVRDNEDLEMDAKIREERKLWQEELDSQLKRVAKAHEDHLKQVIRTQKQLHDIENTQLLEEAVAIERNKFANQIETAVSKLNEIEQALHSRSAQDLENRRAKIYWTLCQNLFEILTSMHGSTDFVQFNEIKLIKELTEFNDLAQTVCNSFQHKLDEQGVASEAALRKRFVKVHKVAWRTAQIDENGGGPLKFLASWVQSLLMLQSNIAYSPDDKINLQNYDPYDLLSRINYFVRNGDLMNAVRLANLLRGESALAFADWIKDTKAHLEARFLTELLLINAQTRSIRSTY